MVGGVINSLVSLKFPHVRTAHTYIHKQIYNAQHSQAKLESEARAVTRWGGASEMRELK